MRSIGVQSVELKQTVRAPHGAGTGRGQETEKEKENRGREGERKNGRLHPGRQGSRKGLVF